MNLLPAWPLSAWLAVLPLLGTALWKPACAVGRWAARLSDANLAREERDLAREERAAIAEREAETGEIERLTARVSDLEDLVDLLRKALDKNLIRESAIAAACELLIALVRMVPEPDGPMLHMRDRAQQLLVDARAHILKGEARP